MNPKELIVKIKEYADIADATYALLQYIEENEKITQQTKKEDEEQIKKKKLPPSRWIYADGIKRGYEVKEANKTTLVKDNHRSLGQPTAYALGIEARFAKDKEITIKDEKRIIKNTIQNFVERDKETPKLENQKIQVSTTKERKKKERTSHYLSYRTKAFTSRYELLHHQKNTSLGYSATLFLDTWAKSEEEKYILAFRGTEAKGDFKNDVAHTDRKLATSSYNWSMLYVLGLKREEYFKQKDSAEYKVLSKVNPQVASLMEHREVVFDLLRKLTKKEDFKLNLVGHSLGGNLAQCFCLVTEDKYISSLYTYNAPGFGGAFISRTSVYIRTLGVISVLVGDTIRGINKKLSGNGMTMQTIFRCIKYCNADESLEDFIRYERELRQTGGSEAIKKSAKKAQQLSKARSGIDIHHIETISQPIPLVDSFSRDVIQYMETSTSVIADLGFYKYGLPFEIKEDEKNMKIIKYDFANTDKLHLLHIGGLKNFYCWSSHFMESTLQIVYFYDYLLKQKDNQNKQVFCGEVADAFNYLASYTQVLIDLISCDKLIKYTKSGFFDSFKDIFRDRSYLLAYLKEIFYVLEHKKGYLNKEMEISFGEEKEVIDLSEFKEIDSLNILDAFMVLDAYGVYTKIIDKYDAEMIGE